MTKYSTFAPGTSKELYEHSDTAISAGISNEMPADIIPHAMAHSWEILRPLMDMFGSKLVINSLFRSKELNEHIGGSPTSEHCLASAVDFKVNNLPPSIVASMVSRRTIRYSQLIRYKTFCHCGRNPLVDVQKKQYLDFSSK